MPAVDQPRRCNKMTGRLSPTIFPALSLPRGVRQPGALVTYKPLEQKSRLIPRPHREEAFFFSLFSPRELHTPEEQLKFLPSPRRRNSHGEQRTEERVGFLPAKSFFSERTRAICMPVVFFFSVYHLPSPRCESLYLCLLLCLPSREYTRNIRRFPLH